jgi:hypothetical protein
LSETPTLRAYARLPLAPLALVGEADMTDCDRHRWTRAATTLELPFQELKG